ncbi:MAG TPA: hypothetical protein VIK67_02110 [Acholeplasma sp.]
MPDYIKIYKDTRKRIQAYNYAFWVMSWDMETEMPKGAFEHFSEQIEV